METLHSPTIKFTNNIILHPLISTKLNMNGLLLLLPDEIEKQKRLIMPHLNIDAIVGIRNLIKSQLEINLVHQKT